MLLHRRSRTAAVALGLLFGSLASAGAPGDPPGEDERQLAPSCEGEEHRAFDFWIGTWEVADPDGEFVGTNTIRPLHGGCALHEQYSAKGPYEGSSLNAYDRRTGTWVQTWVDVTGLVLRLEGGLRDGRMVLEGPGVSRDGDPLTHRISWEALPDGRVRQTWVAIMADGAEKTLFTGLYRKTG
jgi:hypothetical protein